MMSLINYPLVSDVYNIKEKTQHEIYETCLFCGYEILTIYHTIITLIQTEGSLTGQGP